MASVDTHDRVKARSLPQASHQASLYRRLDQLVAQGKLRTIIAEGCSGELTRDSAEKFNGWTVAELEAQAKKPGFAESVVASVPQKLEAKYGTRLKTLCGDDPALIRAHQLAFSDVRGSVGFLSRLIEHEKNPTKAKSYVDAVIDLYELPKNASYDVAVKRVREETSLAYGRLKAALERRNQRALEAVREALTLSPKLPIAIVYGGLHAPGVMAALKAEGVRAEVIEAAGYRSVDGNDEVHLTEQLEQALRLLGVEAAGEPVSAPSVSGKAAPPSD